jgi:acetyl-CoA acetyltransferase
MSSIRDACILGIGATEFLRRGSSGRSELALVLEAIVNAANDAGIDPQEIDGLVSYSHDRTGATSVIDGLGLKKFRFSGQPLDATGGGTTEAVVIAAMAVATGQARYVAVYRSICQTPDSRLGRPGGLFHSGQEDVVRGRRVRHSPTYDETISGPYASPFGLSVPVQHYALEARRHMHEFGTTSRQLGAIAVNARANAARNPNAIRRDPLTIDDYLESRIISSPLRALDCCMESDNAGAIIVGPAAGARDHRQKPVNFLASGYGTVTRITTVHGYDGYPSANLHTMAPGLWERAGIRPDDVDVAQIYDAFTIQVLMAYEDLGFCKRGEGGAFVESGAISWPDGSLPSNTSGGMLSEAYIIGMNLLIEAVRQIRGQSTSQVANAQTCLIAGGHMGALILSA